MRNIKYTLFLFICSFIFINVAHADAVCTYKNNTIEFVCNVSSNKVSCTTSYPSGGTKNVSLTPADFTKNGKIDCDNLKNIYVDAYLDNNGKMNYYDINTTGICTKAKAEYDKVRPSGSKPGSDECFNFNLSAKKTTDSSFKNPSSGNSGTVASNTTTPTTTTEGTYDPASFCGTPATRNVFRALGYVFFIAKIVIPIIIITLASVDLFKAVFASKEDEIKKSIKTLVYRVIAGIVIFFIPSFINFVINLFSNSGANPGGLYNEHTGTFKECTTCMLDPFSCDE